MRPHCRFPSRMTAFVWYKRLLSGNKTSYQYDVPLFSRFFLFNWQCQRHVVMLLSNNPSRPLEGGCLLVLFFFSSLFLFGPVQPVYKRHLLIVDGLSFHFVHPRCLLCEHHSSAAHEHSRSRHVWKYVWIISLHCALLPAPLSNYWSPCGESLTNSPALLMFK